jgi:plastocyanin
MALSGASSDNVITDASGNYTFTGLDNGIYTITPTRTGYTFSPTSSPQTVIGANITAVNFIATSVQVGIYSISGHVEDDVRIEGVPDVTMTLSGASFATTTTDSSGNYTFTGLDNGIYNVTPSKTGYTFSPADNTQTVIGADKTGVNFAATFINAKIVTCPASGTTNVTIQDFSFTPDNVTISMNGIVKWTNNGPSLHTVTPGFLGFQTASYYGSGNLGIGETYCVQYLSIGPHPYFCKIHPTMIGNVIVQ